MERNDRRRYASRDERDSRGDNHGNREMPVVAGETDIVAQREFRADPGHRSAIRIEANTLHGNESSENDDERANHHGRGMIIPRRATARGRPLRLNTNQHVHPALETTSQERYSVQDVISLVNLAAAMQPRDSSSWMQLAIHFGVRARAEGRQARSVQSIHDKIRRIARTGSVPTRITEDLSSRIRELIESGDICLCSHDELLLDQENRTEIHPVRDARNPLMPRNWRP